MKTKLMRVKALLIMCTVLLLAHCTTAQTVYYISTFAGNGTSGYSGDGGAATSAELADPTGTVVDASGNVYIVDYTKYVVRKVNTSGTISTFAGNGTGGFSGDGGAATSAELFGPIPIAVDGSGNIYIGDVANQRIRKVNTSGTISTIAGNGTGGFSGDGGAATSAELNFPSGVAVDGSGNVFIADESNNRIRKINTSGTISTFAGTGTAGFSGDGGAAASAELYLPYGVAVDASGNVYIADYGNDRIRMVNTSGTISTIAGSVHAGFSGDGGAATSAELNSPTSVAVDASGNIYIADKGNERIRAINASGTISTIAGTGTAGYSGDGGVATSAKLSAPTAISLDASNNLYIADEANHVTRKLTPFVVTISIITVPTCFESSGEIQANVSGGVSPYTYAWLPTGYTGQGTADYQYIIAGTYTVTVTDNNGEQAVATKSVLCHHSPFKSGSTGTLEDNEVVTYPNPSSGVFTIAGAQPGSVIEIYNEMGELVKTMKATDDNEEKQVDVSNMTDGIYLIQVVGTDGKVFAHQKMIKIH